MDTGFAERHRGVKQRLQRVGMIKMLGGSKRTDPVNGLQTSHGQDESRMPEWEGQAQGVTDRSAKLRAFFARYVAAAGSARDPRIEQAFAAVPREPFAGPAPWFIKVLDGGYVQTPDDDPAFLYQNTLVALDHDRGINIGEPSLHARCLDALALRDGETVLQCRCRRWLLHRHPGASGRPGRAGGGL